MSLPAAWVDALFKRLTVRYGSRFMGLYAGVDMAAVHADWAECLAVFERHPDAIAYGLERLPDDWPPNAAEFKRICLPALDEARRVVPKLPAPVTDPQRVAEARARMGEAVAAAAEVGADPKGWARRLKALELTGHRLSRVQREAWREALRSEYLRDEESTA